MAVTQVRLSEAIDGHLALLKSQGLAARTIKTHRQTLNHLLVETGNIYLRSMTHVHVERLFAAHAEWASSTRNLHLANLRSFLATCRNRGWLSRDTDPTAGWRNQRVVRAEKRRIPIEEFPSLLAAADHPRDRAILALGLFSFLRGSELQELRIADVNLADHELRIYRSKTREYDVLPISLELAEELEAWLRWYGVKHGPYLDDSWYLVPAKAPNPTYQDPATRRLVQVKGVAPLRPTTQLGHPYRVAQRALHAIGYATAGEGEHTLRRSGARALFDALREEGYDGALQRVRAMLGHKSAAMTEHYLGIDLERRQRNELIGGKVMFPSLRVPGATVTPIREVSGG